MDFGIFCLWSGCRCDCRTNPGEDSFVADRSGRGVNGFALIVCSSLSYRSDPPAQDVRNIIVRTERSRYDVFCVGHIINNAAGLTHTIVLSRQTAVTAGYAYDRDSTDTDFWDYSGNKGYVSFQSRLFDTGIALSTSYYDKKYGGMLAGFTEKRHDTTHEYSVTLDWRIVKQVSLALSDLYVRNNSNLALYEYQRNIVTLMAVMRL